MGGDGGREGGNVSLLSESRDEDWWSAQDEGSTELTQWREENEDAHDAGLEGAT